MGALPQSAQLPPRNTKDGARSRGLSERFDPERSGGVVSVARDNPVRSAIFFVLMGDLPHSAQLSPRNTKDGARTRGLSERFDPDAQLNRKVWAGGALVSVMV
jgi:hypothetical protein